NGRRRWCDMSTCGNRAKAARHREGSDRRPAGAGGASTDDVMVEVTRTFLEMRDLSQLNCKTLPVAGASITRLSHCTAAEYRELYRRVGEQWHWRDRLAWSDDRL